MDKQYKKLSVDFPAQEYVYLKMACAKKGVSMKQFVNTAIVKSISEYEDELDIIALKASMDDDSPVISWEDAQKALGWDKL